MTTQVNSPKVIQTPMDLTSVAQGNENKNFYESTFGPARLPT